MSDLDYLNRKKRWSRWNLRLRLRDITWRSRWTRSSSCFRNRSTCMFMTSKDTRDSLVACQLKKATQSRNFAETRKRLATPWSSLSLRKSPTRVLGLDKVPKLLVVIALSKATISHRRRCPRRTLKLSRMDHLSISFSLASRRPRVRLWQASMLVRALMDPVEMPMLSKHCVTSWETSLFWNTQSPQLELMVVDYTVRRTLWLLVALVSSPKRCFFRPRSSCCLIRESLPMRKCPVCAISTTTTLTQSRVNERSITLAIDKNKAATFNRRSEFLIPLLYTNKS